MFVGGPNIPTLGAIAMLQMGRGARVSGGGSLSETDEEFEQRMAEWEAEDRIAYGVVFGSMIAMTAFLLAAAALAVF